MFFHCRQRNISNIIPNIAIGLVHCNDVIMGSIASQITSLTIVYSTVYSGADQRNHRSSASLAFVRGIHRRPVNSPHKGPVTRKMFPFDDVIMVNPWKLNSATRSLHCLWWKHALEPAYSKIWNTGSRTTGIMCRLNNYFPVDIC